MSPNPKPIIMTILNERMRKNRLLTLSGLKKTKDNWLTKILEEKPISIPISAEINVYARLQKMITANDPSSKKSTTEHSKNVDTLKNAPL